MILNIKLVQKPGSELSEDELAQIKEAILREFKVPFNVNDQAKDRLFFLLKDGDKILSMGALWEVKPVIFDGENFTIYGVLNVVANEKSKGYGKRVVTAMREYLVSQDLTGFGFCFPKNKGFYEKCGLKIEENATKRFIYHKGEERITNQDGQVIFYQESSDNFMKKVLSKQDEEVSIPTNNLW